MRRKRKGGWYLWITETCTVCKKDNTYKVKVFYPKPKDKEKQHLYKEEYCGCLNNQDQYIDEKETNNVKST